MKFTDAIRWGLYDRVLAFASLAIGLAVAVGALWIGTGSWFVSTLTGGGGGLPEGQSLVIAVAGVAAGLVIWQIGSAAARHRTMVSATEKQVHGRLAGGNVDVDAGGGLDARIDQIESDVEEVRRGVSRIEQAMQSGEFTAAGLDDGPGKSAGGSADAGAAGQSAPDQSGSAAAGGGEGVQFSDDEAADPAADDADAAAQEATSTTDGGTAAADDPAEEGFEWPEEDDDGEYYRDS